MSEYKQMSFLFGNLGLYDVLLMTVIVLMILGVAYLKHPRWKAFIMLLPFPSTLATLSIGKPVDVSFLLGLPLLMFFFWFIHFLYDKMHINIIVAITISATVYVITGIIVLPFLPASQLIFPITFSLIVSAGVVLCKFLPPSKEPGYKTTLPMYIKIPIIIIVVFLLVKGKHMLGGFMPMFPMVGVVAAYEAKNCLKTVFSQMPLAFITVGSMFGMCYLTQNIVGLCGGLGLGWLIYLTLLFFTRKSWLPN